MADRTPDPDNMSDHVLTRLSKGSRKARWVAADTHQARVGGTTKLVVIFLKAFSNFPGGSIPPGFFLKPGGGPAGTPKKTGVKKKFTQKKDPKIPRPSAGPKVTRGDPPGERGPTLKSSLISPPP